MLCAKAVAVAILDCLGMGEGTSDDLSKWQFYVWLLGMIVFLLLQTHFLNVSFGAFDALIILPMYTVALILVSLPHQTITTNRMFFILSDYYFYLFLLCFDELWVEQ
jgi:hypothetical protein